jgi:hypothetical protein
MKKFALAFGLLLGASQLPVLAADINSTGTAPKYCSVSNSGGAITLNANATSSALSGSGTFSYLANSDSKVSLGTLGGSAPTGAVAYTPSVSIGSLVTSTGAAADSATISGVTNSTGAISVSVTENNDKNILTSGDYEVTAVATCTSL